MKFDEWFEKNVEPRPSHAPVLLLIKQAREYEEAAKELRDMIVKQNDWEARRSIALVAWKAAGGRE